MHPITLQKSYVLHVSRVVSANTCHDRSTCDGRKRVRREVIPRWLALVSRSYADFSRRDTVVRKVWTFVNWRRVLRRRSSCTVHCSDRVVDLTPLSAASGGARLKVAARNIVVWNSPLVDTSAWKSRSGVGRIALENWAALENCRD